DQAVVAQATRADLGDFGLRLPEGLGLLPRVVGETPAHLSAELVVMPGGWIHPGALLEDDHCKAGGRELLGHDATGGTGTDDDEIHRLRRAEAGTPAEAPHHPIPFGS